MIPRIFLRVLNFIVNTVLALALLISGSYAAYALWDNNQVLTAAHDVQAEMIKLKPEVPVSEEEPVDNTATFAALLALNSDVVGWLTMDNTRVDFPVLQGKDNLTYINRDVYGNFSLAGSIYLDSRNSPAFADSYSLFYGHHMAEGNMFGDLDLYKDESFFRKNRTGVLILPDRTYNLEVISCMLVSASDEYIFEPDHTRNAITELLDYVEKNSMYLHEEVLQQARATSDLQLLALSTCSSEFTDARTIVITVMTPIATGDQEGGTG